MGPGRQGPVASPCWVRACETKPISPGHPGMGASQRGPAGAPAGINRAKQSQFRQNDMRDKCFMGKGLGLMGRAEGLDRTKPIPAPGRLVAEATILSHRGSAATPAVQTKPIYRGGAWGAWGSSLVPRRSGLRPSPGPLYKQTQSTLQRAQKPATGSRSAKQSQFPGGAYGTGAVGFLPRASPPGSPAFPEPIPHKQTQFASPRLREPPVGRTAAKQSQFPPVRPTRWTRNRQLRADRGNPPPYPGHPLSWADGNAPLR